MVKCHANRDVQAAHTMFDEKNRRRRDEVYSPMKLRRISAARRPPPAARRPLVVKSRSKLKNHEGTKNVPSIKLLKRCADNYSTPIHSKFNFSTGLQKECRLSCKFAWKKSSVRINPKCSRGNNRPEVRTGGIRGNASRFTANALLGITLGRRF